MKSEKQSSEHRLYPSEIRFGEVYTRQAPTGMSTAMVADIGDGGFFSGIAILRTPKGEDYFALAGSTEPVTTPRQVINQWTIDQIAQALRTTYLQFAPTLTADMEQAIKEQIAIYQQQAAQHPLRTVNQNDLQQLAAYQQKHPTRR